MAHAQGLLSNLSIGAGFEGIFPAATVTKATSNLSGFPTTQWTTNSVGAVGDARYDFGHHSALDFSVTVNRDTEIFEDASQAVTRVQTNNAELIGSYIFRLPSNEKIKPYALLGGGVIRFSPNNNFTGLTPSTESKPTFAYGFGTDFKLSDPLGHPSAVSRPGPHRSRLQAPWELVGAVWNRTPGARSRTFHPGRLPLLDSCF